jgi:peptidoglycan/xylan/chitin deacetylase (PgdA/CDA1 family)
VRARAELACFGYHEVTDDPTASGFQRLSAARYKMSRAEFARHLDGIARSPYPPTLVHQVDFGQRNRHVLLTFDDGGKSALHINEELCRRGWRGHFFVITSFIGRRHFLDAGEIRHIHSCGHRIGSHSHTHPDIFCDLTASRMAEEWRVSCDLLAQLLGEPCDRASVPGGDISREMLETAGAAGLRFLFTSEPHLVPCHVNGAWVLGRYSPQGGTAAARVSRLARFQGWHSALLSRRLKVLARRAAPALYREYVRRTTREQESPVT